VGAAYFSYSLARRLGAGRGPSIAAASLLALGAVPIYFAPRALGDSASMLPIAAGFALALPRGGQGRRLLGAALLAAAVFIRLEAAVLCAALLVGLLAQKRFRDGLEVAAVLVIGAYIYGALDLLTWGDWFHSTRVLVGFDLQSASLWGTSPFTYYATRLVAMPWLWGIAVAAPALVGARRSPTVALAVAAFWLLHSATPHKEFRYILPSLPLIIALAGLGLDDLRKVSPALFAPAASAVLAIAIVSAVTAGGLSFQNLNGPDAGPGSAYDLGGPANRLLLAAHSMPDLCGLAIEDEGLEWTGGYTYLDRQVPVFRGQQPGPRAYNYVLADTPFFRSHPPPDGSLVVRSDHDWSLVRISADCPATAPVTGHL
jgi:hypothetical protein